MTANRSVVHTVVTYVGLSLTLILSITTIVVFNPLVRQNIGKIYPDLEIHTEIYILIDLCSAEARGIISTGSTKFHPVAIF